MVPDRQASRPDHVPMSEPEIRRDVLWQKLRRGEVRAAAHAGGLVLLPLGAVEQHGPHLPLDTDSVTAFTVCARAAERVREFPVLVLPPIWWGLSPYWMQFPGTLTLAPETLIALIATSPVASRPTASAAWWSSTATEATTG